MVGFLSHLRNKGVMGPYLVVGPLSTLPNWVNEFKRWTPDVPVLLYHGSQVWHHLSRIVTIRVWHGATENRKRLLNDGQIPNVHVAVWATILWREIGERRDLPPEIPTSAIHRCTSVRIGLGLNAAENSTAETDLVRQPFPVLCEPTQSPRAGVI